MNPEMRVVTPREAEEKLTPKQRIAAYCFTRWINDGLIKGKRRFDNSNGDFWGDRAIFYFLGFSEEEAGKVLKTVIRKFENQGWGFEDLDPQAPYLHMFKLTS